MKITESKLRQIIQEELSEQWSHTTGDLQTDAINALKKINNAVKSVAEVPPQTQEFVRRVVEAFLSRHGKRFTGGGAPGEHHNR